MMSDRRSRTSRWLSVMGGCASGARAKAAPPESWTRRAASGDPVGFNMWGDIRKGFFSPEPWWGKQNALATGDGVVRLEPGARFEWAFKVSINN